MTLRSLVLEFPKDILARGVNGELYPIKKENFDIIFEVL